MEDGIIRERFIYIFLALNRSQWETFTLYMVSVHIYIYTTKTNKRAHLFSFFSKPQTAGIDISDHQLFSSACIKPSCTV